MKNHEIQKALRDAILKGMNVLLEGTHGTGKSSMVLLVTRELGLTMKYFSASTLDPFADLVGIPVPVEQDGKRSLVYHQQQDLLEAEVLVFDELNRAHPKVLNAVLEIIQFRSINGTRLPRLRCVIAAVNPSKGDYQVNELDPALVDRFHLYLAVGSRPDNGWFRTAFGEKLGAALVDWYLTDLDKTQQDSVSPRRLEYIGQALKNGIAPAHAIPPKIKLPFHLLEQRLKEAETVISIEDFVADPAKFTREVAKNLSIAIRFSQLLPMMRPAAKNRVKDILLALPNEMLAQLLAQHPFVFPATVKAIRSQGRAEDALAFEKLLDERLQTVRTLLNTPAREPVQVNRD